MGNIQQIIPTCCFFNQKKSISPSTQETTNRNSYSKEDNLNFSPLHPKQIENATIEKLTITAKAIQLSDFLLIKFIGKGAFGQVVLVMHKQTMKKYAMKILKKSDIQKANLCESILLEKNILQNCNHPFLVKLKYAFQTNLKFYLVMEYIEGGELYAILKQQRHFTEDQARFYLSEIILGIEFLHTKLNIIYRDLKPENILLKQTGHIKLIDFGLAKNPAKLTKSFVGTAEYLAPEVIKGTEQTKSLDLWTLGILLYEMLIGFIFHCIYQIFQGYPPFISQTNNFAEIQQKILENSPFYPPYLSNDAIHLIQSLLKNDPSQRIGSGENLQELKAHSFFKNVDWLKLLHLKVIPPIQNTQVKVKKLQRQVEIKETYEKISNFTLTGFTYVEKEQSCLNKAIY